MRAVVTVIGKDRVGIIAGVATELARCNANILDISQTTLQEYFTMIMIVDVSAILVPFGEMQDRMTKLGVEMGLSIRVQHQDIFDTMHKV